MSSRVMVSSILLCELRALFSVSSVLRFSVVANNQKVAP
jgi:hypothetical protein